MKKKVCLQGPILSLSGYGQDCRRMFRALKSREDLFDIYVRPSSFGMSSWLSEDSEERREIDALVNKTQQYLQQNGQFDIGIQVGIPTEWKRFAPLMIGVTAGVEVNKAPASFLLSCNSEVDKVITPSEFSAKILKETTYSANDTNGNPVKLRLTTPIEAIGFATPNDASFSSLELKLNYDFNFLCVGQTGPRKNVEFTINSFYKTFQNHEVGLVLKITKANNSINDREFCFEVLKNFKDKFPEAKCKIYLLHGNLSDKEMRGLYNHPKLKAIINLSHGEGFGIPMFDAVCCGMPVICHDFGGQTDFLYAPDSKGKRKPHYAKVDFDIKQIAQADIMPGILEADSFWAYPRELSVRQVMLEVYKDFGRFSGQARRLQRHVSSEFSEKKIYDKIVSVVSNRCAPIEPKDFSGISFCIPTNGKRPEKTKLLIESIRRQKGKSFEIILCGDVENFKHEKDVILIDQKEAAHSRKVALLRNKAAEMARFGVIAWCDDDILLDSCWMANTLEHSKKNGWNVLGNVMLNPDGTRQWDRATLNPHVLVDYDDRSNNNMYQSSGFFLARRKVWKDVKWDETKLVYADRDSQSIPEDVQYSLDCQKAGYILSFNKDALVWHNDENYTAINNVTLLKSAVLAQVPSYPFLGNSLKYLKIIGELENV